MGSCRGTAVANEPFFIVVGHLLAGALPQLWGQMFLGLSAASGPLPCPPLSFPYTDISASALRI